MLDYLKVLDIIIKIQSICKVKQIILLLPFLLNQFLLTISPLWLFWHYFPWLLLELIIWTWLFLLNISLRIDKALNSFELFCKLYCLFSINLGLFFDSNPSILFLFEVLILLLFKRLDMFFILLQPFLMVIENLIRFEK